MMEEYGLSIDHTTIMRWVHQYGSELDERVRRYLKATNYSWRVEQIYVKVKGQWMYLYRAVDSEGNTIAFYLNKTRDHKAAKRFGLPLVKWIELKNTMQSVCFDIQVENADSVFSESVHDYRTKYNSQGLDRDGFLFYIGKNTYSLF